MHLLKAVLLATVVILGDRITAYSVRNNGIDPVICESFEHGTKIPNPIDCSSFYVCDRGYPEHVQCTEGLLFDVNLKVCNWPESTTCVYGSLPHKTPESSTADHFDGNVDLNNPDTPMEIPLAEVPAAAIEVGYKPDPQEPALLPDDNDVHPTITEQNAPASFIPPEKIEITTEVKQGGHSSQENSNSEEINQIIDELPQEVSLADNSEVTESAFTKPNEQQSNENKLIKYPFNGAKIDIFGHVECTQDGVYYLPHPTKCEYYYLCISKNVNQNYCGENLYWDYMKQRCDLPSASLCYSKLQELSKPPAVETWRPELTDTSVTQKEDVVYSTSSSKSPEFYTTPISNNVETVANIDSLEIKPKPPTALIPEADLTAVPPPPTPLDGYDPQHVRCVHEGVYFLPHPTDCQIYFICLNHTLNIHRCGHNTQWDYIYNQCTVPDPYRCYSSRNGTMQAAGNDQFEEGPIYPLEGYDPDHIRCVHPGFYFLPHPTNCRRYFVCSNYTLSIYQCTLETTWNYETQQCSSTESKCYYEEVLSKDHEVEKKHDLSEILLGYDPNLIRCLHDGVYYLPHPTQCQFYFICAYRTLTLHECSKSTVWNYAYERCDYPDRSECFDSSEYRTTQTTQKATTTTSRTTTAAPKTAPIITTTAKKTTRTTPTVPSTTTTSTSKPKTTPGSDGIKDNASDADSLPKCPRHQAFYPHPKDCRKYYICIGGVPILTKCPENLYWDTQRKMCSLPSHTKCTVGRKA